MFWRKWIVRGIVYGIIGAAGVGALGYQRLTNPGAVREQLIAQLGKAFPGAQVSVDSARLRILGGIQLNGLRLTRGDDPEGAEFLHVPSAIFYHDKEKILDGELTLRKIELIRPRLRVRRERDGSWNLQNLLRPSTGEPEMPIPAIVIHQGTILLEDNLDPAKAGTLEINDVSLTIINDPLPRVAIQGAANSELIGKLQLYGAIDRHTREAFLSFRATQIPLTQALVSRLPIQCPNDLFLGLELQAAAQVEGKVSYHPSQPRPMFYDVRCEIKDGKIRHPKMPLPLDGLCVKLHCTNGEVELQTLTARSGTTEIEARGAGQLPCLEREFEVHLALKHVILGRDLSERLPPKLRDLHDLFRPEGPTSIHITCAKHDGDWTTLANGKPSYVSLRPEDISLAFKGFPYPLERTTGEVKYNLLDQRVDVDLKAHASGDRPVLLNGRWIGEDDQADVDFNIFADDVPIDEKLSQALDIDALRTLRAFGASFHATGKLNVRANIRHRPGDTFKNVFHLHFHDTAVCWDQFPYPLKNVSGTINVYPNHWEFQKFQGTHNGGLVVVNGKSIPKDARGFDHGVSLEISGHNVQLDEQLRDALRPMKELHKAWETFNPSGPLYFTASVNRPSSDLADLEVHVDAKGCTARPAFFPFRLDDISGNFRFHKMRLEISKLRAKHDQAMIALDHGAVDLNPRGGYYAKLLDLQVQGLRFDDEFVHALPAGKLQDAGRSLKLQDPLRVQTQLVISQPSEQGKPPDVYWDTHVWMYGAKVNAGLEFNNIWGEFACRGRYDGRTLIGVEGNMLVDQATVFQQPFKKVHAKFEIRKESPDRLLVGLRAPIYSGDVTGQIRVDLNSSLNYEVNLTASQINLAEFGRQNLGPKSQLSGLASARLHLTGLGSGIDSLDGHGAVDIPRGHLYNLPFLLDLLKFLGLHWPDRTAFEEFHTAFSITGSKVAVQKLDLVGSAVSLAGKGEMDLGTKDVKLDIYPMWGRLDTILPPAVRPLPASLSKSLVTVEVRGKVTSEPKDLKFRLKPVPVIVDPILLIRDRLIGPAPQPEPAPPTLGPSLNRAP